MNKSWDEQKKKLLEEQDEIVKEMKTLGVVDFGSDTESEVAEEEADEAEEFSKNKGIEQELKGRLIDVKNALDKIATGTYGKCEKCGMEIEAEVLAVDPESRLCKMDKK
ncbi:MAG: hypothetical protein Q7S83_02355 [bacterium]|nr:hypothetical protein [bacterium]